MAATNLRLAAGVGVVVAFLFVGGPTAAVAIADPGGSHSGRPDRDRSDRGDRGDSRGGSRGDHDRDNDDDSNSGDRGGDNDNRKNDDADNDSDKKSTSDSGEDQGITVSRGGTQGITSLSPQTDAGNSDEDAVTPDIPGADQPDAGQSGSDNPGAPKVERVSPRVTFGNGRTPRYRGERTAPPSDEGVAPEPAPPPPPPPVDVAPAPAWVDRIPAPRFVPQIDVAPAAVLRDPMFGFAGLLLIPAAGAMLGYRQARAAHEASKLRQT